jgi:hypothetical protein
MAAKPPWKSVAIVVPPSPQCRRVGRLMPFLVTSPANDGSYYVIGELLDWLAGYTKPTLGLYEAC